MAREFAAKGRNLALCARRLDRLESLRDELLAANPGITIEVSALDVCNYEQVFTVFRELDASLGGIDRVIVNAGIDSSQPLGTGQFDANRRTANTNFVAALAQCEAAMELFRPRNAGHLVVLASVSAYRGQPSTLNIYAATKAGVASLAEGLRMELRTSPIKVTTLFPGFIRSEINEKIEKRPFMVEMEVGVKALVKAIEAEVSESSVPKMPWAIVGFFLRVLPWWIVARSYE